MQCAQKLLPVVNRHFNTTSIPSGLDEIELKYKERVEWPRSRYDPKAFYTAVNAFRYIPDEPYVNGPELIKQFNHPWRVSTRFEVDLTLDRNKRALKKAASLPAFGKKQEQIAAAKQYVSSVIKPSGAIQDMYSIMPGYRTQQSSIDDPKVRLIWAFPSSTWLLEDEAYDDGISRTIEENRGENNKHIKLFYCRPEEVSRWVKDSSSRVQHWANLDATQYDATVRASELAECIHHFAGDYEFADLLADYQIRASLVLSQGDLIRQGGMPSGSKITNLGDGWTNVADVLGGLERMKILRYLEAVLVSGDDISLGFSTKLTKSNINKLNRYSRRNINADKSMLREYVWNSKWYMDEDIMTRPVYRVINSMIFKEHQTNPITGSKEYVTIAFAQQVKDLEEHPLFEKLLPAFLAVNKYPLSSMGDDQIREAADHYVDEHYNAQVHTSDEFIKQLRESKLVQAGG